MKWKIVKGINEYTLCAYEKEEGGTILLTFWAETGDEASFIYNQFLHFEPYKPFGIFWYVKVGHQILIAGKSKSKHNYEERTLIVLAENEAKARQKVTKEATEYARPYKNGYDQEVVWKFDKILEVKEMDFFDTIDLYRGKPVEIHDKIKTKRKLPKSK